jgi:hypothetical protein
MKNPLKKLTKKELIKHCENLSEYSAKITQEYNKVIHKWSKQNKENEEFILKSFEEKSKPQNF